MNYQMTYHGTSPACCTTRSLCTSSKEVSILPFTKNGIAYTEANLTASVKAENNRCKDIPKLERLIEKSWICYTEKNPTLVNKLKFRLHTAEDDEENGVTHLHLGLTNCKEHLGTNCLLFPHDLRQLQTLGVLNNCDRRSYFAQWLGVGALILTPEKKYIFLRRSCECCEMRPLLDRASGCPDPEKVRLEPGECDLAKATSEDLVHEIFASVLRGITHEVGIPGDAIEDIEFLGLTFCKIKGERPTAEFHVKTPWPTQKIIWNYMNRRHKLCYNSCNIIFTSEEEVRNTPLNHSMFFKGLAPCGKGAILLLREQIRQLKEVERERARGPKV
uniref:Nudix hydrolase domain-containing protein n=1 Tax=Strigamia maritima TaxID=126957 RepID=T1ISL5_STRMM